MPGMFSYSKAAVERAMKAQEVMMRAWAKKITWFQAAEILQITDRHLRRRLLTATHACAQLGISIL